MLAGLVVPRVRLEAEKTTAYLPVTSPASKRGRQRASHVLLLSSARSGSSLTGDIMNHDEGVYYVFEPLHNAESFMWKRLARRNATLDDIEESLRSTADLILDAFFSCRFSDLDLSQLDMDFLQRNPETAELASCVLTYLKWRAIQDEDDPQTTSIPEKLSQCIKSAETNCSQANTRLLKVIRVRVDNLEQLMLRHPDLVVIVLIRDPRASIWSRTKAFSEPWANHSSYFPQGLCRDIENDLSASVRLNTVYPGRIKIVRYESLAENPILVSRCLYNYTGLAWSKNVQNLIEKQTFAGKYTTPVTNSEDDKVKDQTFTVVREDSSQTAHAWRSDADWNFVIDVQKNCFGVLRQLGYRLFRFEQDLRQIPVLPGDMDPIQINDDVLLCV
ncbi:hypothetical protein BaRGS_00036038 [Batillaria attramentaria]|uniref:Sulfotransferase n=1 Tax=Batillaria attramentaria TaxID=370345 RepID=A0ABD0JCH4_9CAEN